MKITKRQLRRIIKEEKAKLLEASMPPRSASEVLGIVLNRAMEISRERNMTAADLNDGGFDALIDEAFEELTPVEFASRDELATQHTRDLNDTEERMRRKFANEAIRYKNKGARLDEAPDEDYHLTVIGSVFNELANLADGAPPEEYPGEWKETVESLRDWLGEVLGKW